MKERQIDIICVSEANIIKDDEVAEINIDGFDLLTDNLLKIYGRAHSAIYINNNIKHKISSDLMDKDEPEVWIEVRGTKHVAPILLSQFYREHLLIWGEKSIEGIQRLESQRNR